MKKLTMNQIEKKVDELNRIAPHPDGYRYKFDFIARYGGYRLFASDTEGTHYGAFGESSCCPRMPRREFIAYLNGLLAGLKWKN